jgi:hypothetical protein
MSLASGHRRMDRLVGFPVCCRKDSVQRGDLCFHLFQRSGQRRSPVCI